jgi:hypothetical protein
MEDDDSDSNTMDSHTMDLSIDSRIVHRGPPPGKQQREMSGGDLQVEPAGDTARSGGPRAHLLVEDTADWSEMDKLNGGKRRQMIGGGGPVPIITQRLSGPVRHVT